ncbi:hypothetical protein [Streptomyces sp. NBC_00151]|uniref:hypothetical protein n=1 Tax=Streptomyces sp. NBC_00151 TaxID=2975669 RepID=UPI002DD81B88|nr:hypothetical protein [Streptomyces sp. NBC_00151]WRZ39734.1 hypothetical protein OG915_17775 [Streptomyces sp. NBC_00151]
MRRRISLVMMSGLLAVSAAPAVPAAAGESCGPSFGEHLRCWSRSIAEGTVHVTVDQRLPFDGDAESHKGYEKALLGQRARLVVEVPERARTGPGGTALLLLADQKARLVAGDATIEALPKQAVDELVAREVCDLKAENDPCALLAQGSLTGDEFVRRGLAVDLSRHTYGIDGTLGATSAASPADGGTTSGNGSEDKKQSQERETDPISPTDPGDDAGWDTATAVLTVLCAVLVLLLGLLLFLIRRSARSVAVGTLSRRSLAAQGVGAVPAAATPRPRTRPRTQMPDEATTRIRATPAPRNHGRRVGNVPGPARPAVVRTELHPQGYVEVEHVLYRAVWAEPGRPPPAPGGLVDVTEAGERDSDVLYAFPPTAGRHAKATRP